MPSDQFPTYTRNDDQNERIPSRLRNSIDSYTGSAHEMVCGNWLMENYCLNEWICLAWKPFLQRTDEGERDDRTIFCNSRT